ncbi:MAG TPA: tetratricopeptide repeat protein [Methylibium sp.]|uniref:tetratricopeptide repeat protein n=1 Tax=Methylibium sp. TaxID=2067992 RepID=UPI002DBBC863|nr:tetratricopeptide repeat protein [Methylibium sp.]HEU4459169.1 tetratricopeptide repeat protein [Methylibium sp.]
MRRRIGPALTLVACAALAACASKRSAGTPDNEPTIASLAGRQVEVVADAGVKTDEEAAMAAYRKFLETAPQAKDAPQRAQAERRLGDLEMDLTDSRIADGRGGLTASGAPDYKAAIARYQSYLKTYPNDPGNDRVLYQLSRAQEQSGELEPALKTLDRLVAEYPDTVHREEAQFRRGELLFAARDYPRAERAYATVLAGAGPAQGGTFKERSLYMRGWSVFKQGRLDEALKSFFGVLDLTVANIPESELGDGSLEAIPGLSRGDRELVEDTFRVASLSLANLQGAESIPAYIDSDARRSYEFRVYQQLGELYVKQERVKDAADTYAAFARKHPLHAQAPVLQTRVIEIYEKNGFDTLALAAKKDYVSRYGIDGAEFRRANPAGWERAQPLVKTHLTELARHHHAVAQKNKASGDYQEAVRWYRLYLRSFPTDADAPGNHFLLAELLREDERYAEAAAEYERTAYDYPAHAKSADAGYAALLSYAGREKKTGGAEQRAVQKQAVESAQRYAAAFPGDARTGAVLTNAAEKLYAIGDGAQAALLAQQVLAPGAKADASQRRVANTVLAHTAFERGDFAAAEKSYADVLALAPAADAKRGELVERQAAAIYKQGEKAREAGDAKAAVGHFMRVAQVAPQSTIRANAQYDAAAAQLGMKDWDAAAKNLEDFRARHPKHPLADEVSGKLAVAYLEQERWGQAAAEFEKLAEQKRDPKLAREALWQSGGLYERQAKANPSTAGVSRQAAAKAYERYLKQYPEPFENAMEARFRLATLAKQDGNATREAALMRELYNADRAAGSQRTARTRYLGASAALAMAAPAEAEYRKVQLVEPLARQLKLKKSRMEDVLKAYAVAADYGVADVLTATTHQTALLYQDFGRAMMKSERPRKLGKAELEQYNLMLEEQADPFLEKAVELHEVNARRASQGVYDEWVRKSFKALAELRPVRYGKSERVEGVIDAIR